MTVRIGLGAAWLGLSAIPFLWWLLTRGRVDVWSALPVPAALLGTDGAVLARGGPPADVTFDVPSALPARGHVVRLRGSDGTAFAVAGVRGGALALALPADAVAERRDRVLAELGSRLAHDINTPVGALHGHLDLIAHEPVSDAARESVRVCQRELSRLQTTAQDLLAFTRLRAGGGRRSRQLAGALAEEAAAALLDRADGAGATITVVVPQEVVAVEAAEADLVRALRNLLVNALSHGLGELRQVELQVLADEERVTFCVVDSGTGLSQDQLVTLSEPMVRGPGATAAGSGLGLAIAAEVLAGHGSTLRAGRDAAGRPAISFTLRRVP
ncbi:MAG: hypothetical protein NVSMB55_12910 [Mycobacteriales bacterium]